MSKKKEKKYYGNTDEVVELDIPEDEIWSYQIEGMKAPHINKPFTHFTLKRVIFTVAVVLAVALSILFSMQALTGDTLEYDALENGYRFSVLRNTGYIKELNIDFVRELVYDKEGADSDTNFKLVPDETKPITEIREYALNCDEKVEVIHIGASVEKL